MKGKKVFPKVKEIIRGSHHEAYRSNDVKIKPEHILLSMLLDDDNNAVFILEELDVNLNDVISQLEDHLIYNNLNPPLPEIKILPLSDETKYILSYSELESEKLMDDFIDTEHILLSILKNRRIMANKILKRNGVNYEKVKGMLEEIKFENSIGGELGGDEDEDDEDFAS